MGRISFWTFLLLLSLIAAPLPAHASFSPLGAISSSPRGQALQPQVAMDVHGNAVFVWVHYGEGFRIEARARSADGTLRSIQALSDPNHNAVNPQVGVDAAGNAIFVWARSDGANNRIEARARSADGALTATQLLSAPGRNAFSPQVAVDHDGDAVFVWSRRDATTGCGGSGCFRIQARVRSAAGALSAIQTLSAAGQHAADPQVAVDASGKTIFVWARRDGTKGCGGAPGCFVVQARARSAGGSLSLTQNLSLPGQSSEAPKVGVDVDGDAVFAWLRPDGTTGCGWNLVPGCVRAQTRSRAAGGALSATQDLSAPGHNAEQPVQVGVDNAGNAVFVWPRQDPTTFRVHIRARVRSAGGTLFPIEAVSAPGADASEPRVAVDRMGNAVFVWLRRDGTHSCDGFGCVRAQARGRSPEGVLLPIETLSAAGQNASGPAIVADPDGGLDPSSADAAAAWARPYACCKRIEAAVQIAPTPF
jgi:hypothetical protein